VRAAVYRAVVLPTTDSYRWERDGGVGPMRARKGWANESAVETGGATSSGRLKSLPLLRPCHWRWLGSGRAAAACNGGVVQGDQKMGKTKMRSSGLPYR
jgi:hypothetical protein